MIVGRLSVCLRSAKKVHTNQLSVFTFPVSRRVENSRWGEGRELRALKGIEQPQEVKVEGGLWAN